MAWVLTMVLREMAERSDVNPVAPTRQHETLQRSGPSQGLSSWVVIVMGTQ